MKQIIYIINIYKYLSFSALSLKFTTRGLLTITSVTPAFKGRLKHTPRQQIKQSFTMVLSPVNL